MRCFSTDGRTKKAILGVDRGEAGSGEGERENAHHVWFVIINIVEVLSIL